MVNMNLLCLLLFTVVIGCASGRTPIKPPPCPKNEIYDYCPSYCDNVPCSWIGKKDCNPNGPDECIPACVCKGGLYRNAKGQCVTKETCSPVCGKNEIKRCGPFCDEECPKLPTLPKKGNKKPVKPCAWRCNCRVGYVRNPQGACVKTKDCPKPCPVNSRWNNCASACPLTCKPTTILCIRPCVARCECNKGYVIGPKGDCIKIKDCPKCKKDKEVWTECVKVCPETCDGLDSRKRCSESCKPGCDCMKGTVRDKNGNCIPPEQCPCSDEDDD